MQAETTIVSILTAARQIGQPGAAYIGQRKRETMEELANFFNAAAGGAVPPGTTVDVQQNVETMAQSTGTITLATVAAGDGILVNGVLFVGTANAATTAGGGEFTCGVSNTADGAALAAAINACTDPRVAGVVTAAAAAGVVTLTAVDVGLDGNAITMIPIGQVGRGTVTYSSSSGAQTVSINGVSITVGTGATDAANAALCASTINASANALVKGNVVAYQGGGTNNGKCYVYSLNPGALGNTVTLSVTGTGATASAARLASGANGTGTGTQASGTVTISSGSGTITITINGVVFSTTWATSDTATAAALVVLIAASTNALVAGVVTSSSSSGVVTVTSVEGGPPGNQITLAASGTGATASGARLTSGAVPATLTPGGGGNIIPSSGKAGLQLSGGVGGEGAINSFLF